MTPNNPRPNPDYLQKDYLLKTTRLLELHIFENFGKYGDRKSRQVNFILLNFFNMGPTFIKNMEWIVGNMGLLFIKNMKWTFGNMGPISFQKHEMIIWY